MSRLSFDYTNFQSLNRTTLPFKANSGLTSVYLDHAVTSTGNYEVGLGSDGDAPVGKLLYLGTSSLCTVETGEALILPGVSGSLPSYGNYVVVNGAGHVRAGTSADAGYAGKRNHVVGVDTATQNVVVMF